MLADIALGAGAFIGLGFLCALLMIAAQIGSTKSDPERSNADRIESVTDLNRRYADEYIGDADV